ncbi:MAG TPA: hypothetical protein VNB91_14265, partial [Jatrophihabitantaceae bacterium]|nr:hypothetical protein [Jatrophihabitantaceae bacterium]
RSDLDPRKPAVREIVGVDPQLTLRWSARRRVIKNRSAELSLKFQHDHGRPPTPVEALRLSQQATLEPAMPSMSPPALPSNAPPGTPRPPKPSADPRPYKP